MGHNIFAHWHHMCVQEYENSSIMTINKGPKHNLKELSENVAKGQVSISTWAESARISALLGSNRKTHNEFKCGVRAWLQFAKLVGYHGREVPPTPEMLLQWSMLFRCICFCVIIVAVHLHMVGVYLQVQGHIQQLPWPCEVILPSIGFVNRSIL